MGKYWMSDNELMLSYKYAADKREQVKILSELCCTSPSAMYRHLQKIGCEMTDLPPRQKTGGRRQVIISKEELLQIACDKKSGMSGQEIADKYHHSKKTIRRNLQIAGWY